METQKGLHENISALADGELGDSEVELAVAALGTPEGQAAWDAYHQIGHTLRSDHIGAELSPGFGARLAAALAAEAPHSALMPDQAAEADLATVAPPVPTTLD